MSMSGATQDDFFRYFLNRRSNIHEECGDVVAGLARGLSKELFKASVRHGEATTIIEIRHVHAEGTVVF